ncbi:hypothetical protein CONCODRAFT_82538 [Conidiobolus coronatus NRRL 28638]|uniref:DNA polymerase delta subunit 3 n=1 Tax=Conidiobolus coronatus (strain ATCC 28846 / CBS 209.66 / NRRL 28638) TaxID=796925 RepID=A0A137PJ27_CONC2|nr:hypothetical protein CONCODRAFT_82538 [Conidiobolus coronatus NRRL 28638]|eukprot:KXN74985.1 hypothetical protein CONCODRAFT_82538 [Conidiobolus coronatus NRRL 28638]
MLTELNNKDKIIEYLNIEVNNNNIITYKSLALEFELPLKLSQLLLNEYSESKLEENETALNVWYYIVGEVNSGEFEEIKIQLAFGKQELKEKCDILEKINNVFCYAIGPYTKEKDVNQLTELVKSNHKFFALSNMVQVLQLGGRYHNGYNYEKFEKLEGETKAKLECLNNPEKAIKKPVISAVKPAAVPVKIEAKPATKRTNPKTTKPEAKKPKIDQQFFKSKSISNDTITSSSQKSFKSTSISSDTLTSNSQKPQDYDNSSDSEDDEIENSNNNRKRGRLAIISDEEEEVDESPLEAVYTGSSTQQSNQNSEVSSPQELPQTQKTSRPSFLDDLDEEFEVLDDSAKPKAKATQVKKEEVTKSIQEQKTQAKPKPSANTASQAANKPKVSDNGAFFKRNS